jgi:hypothetical protein
MGKQGMFQQHEAAEVEAETLNREREHDRAEAAAKGRKPRADRERKMGLGLKITRAKMEQLVRLTKLTNWTQTDIIEAALDSFEREWKSK